MRDRREARPGGAPRHSAGLTRCGLLALAALAAFAAPAGAFGMTAARAAPTTGSIGLRLVDVPASTGGDPRAQLYIVDHLAPATVIHRRIEVLNTTAAVAHVALYAGAATVVKGSFLGSVGHAANEVSRWTSVAPTSVNVPAGGQVISTVTIKVPADAAPGERYGAVWAEVRSAPSASGVTQVNRVGIRIYLSVGPGGAPAADFAISSLVAGRTPEGRSIVQATVRNTGGRALDISGALQLTAGPSGLRAGPFPATLGTTVAIGATEQVTVALGKKLPAGPWHAKLTLRSELVEHSASAAITFPGSGKPPAGTGRNHAFLLLFSLGMTGTGLLVLLVRHRRRGPSHAHVRPHNYHPHHPRRHHPHGRTHTHRRHILH